MTVFLSAGLALILLVGLVVMSVYDPDLMRDYAWAEPVFWALVGVGVFRAGIEFIFCSVLPCLWPRIPRFLRRPDCQKAPCTRRQ